MVNIAFTSRSARSSRSRRHPFALTPLVSARAKSPLVVLVAASDLCLWFVWFVRSAGVFDGEFNSELSAIATPPWRRSDRILPDDRRRGWRVGSGDDAVQGRSQSIGGPPRDGRLPAEPQGVRCHGEGLEGGRARRRSEGAGGRHRRLLRAHAESTQS